MATNSDFIIRPMSPEDSHAIVEIHMTSFRGFFLTFLGRNFLNLLYLNMQTDPDGIVLVACSDGKIHGFVAGTTRQSEFYRRLIGNHKWSFARVALRSIAERPTIIPRLLRALRQPAEAEHASAPACLMSIAVSPEMQGKSIGQSLVKELCQELVKRRVAVVCLTTDRDRNDRANRFYKELGFEIARSYSTPEGRAMNEYVLSLKGLEEVGKL